MNIKHWVARSITTVSAVMIASLSAVSPALALPNNFDRGVYVYDKFNNEDTILQPAEGAYWWIDGQGTLPNGDPARVRGEDNCDLQTCVQIVEEGEDGVVRLQGFPTTTTANYTNANLSEDIDGADTDPLYMGQAYPGPWNPSPGHSVTVEAKIKFGPNFNKDGSGGAKGTAGIWLWSNPFSQGAPDPFVIYDGIGFSWASQETEVAQGLTMTVLKGTFPVFSQPVLANINMNDWNTYKYVWSEDILGNQSVSYYINGAFQTTAPMIAGFTTVQDMGLEVWLDNQAFVPSQYPNYVQRIIVTEERHFDVDYVSIKKN